MEYTVTEAAKYLGISYETFNRYERTGKIVTFKKPSGKKYVTQEVLDAFKNGTLSSEDVLRLKLRKIEPLKIGVDLEHATLYPEYSDKDTKYYDVSCKSINTPYTDLEVQTDGVKVSYTLGKINKETEEFESVMKWEE